jgi:hypothetical protein
MTEDINHLREVIDLKFCNVVTKIDKSDLALALATKETERRLSDLNHEAERLKSMQITYLPRESFELAHNLLVSRIDSLSKLVYIGLGICVTLEVLLQIFKK